MRFIYLLTQCDTFARSNDAVFELSTRFVEPFKHQEGLADDAKLEAERLMFMELTQSAYLCISSSIFYILT